MTTTPEEMIWGDAACRGPDTRYMMRWQGAWRPVITMLDARNHDTTAVMRCAKAVLFVELDHWVAVVIDSPGEIMLRPDRDPKARRWEMVH